MSAHLYVETSAVVRAVLEGDEPLKKRFAAGGCVTSALTFVEAARALIRAERERRLDAKQAAVAARFLAAFERTCDVIELTRDVLQGARETFPVEPVRSLDALHLTSVRIVDAALGGVAVASCDDRVRRNAAAWGLTVVP